MSADLDRQGREGAAYRPDQDRLVAFEQLARIVIMRRAELGLSQDELARRMGTTASAISRIESGQRATSVTTLKRLAEALEGRALIGFEFGSGKRHKRELVSL